MLSDISIHAPTRGATCGFTRQGCQLRISIHAPTRGATLTNSGEDSSTNISIHAPTRGATKKNFESRGIIVISIHAPTRGATVILSVFSLVMGFQSTLPRGERPELCKKRPKRSRISIHAPTRGATSTSPYGVNLLIDFNPRSHEGSDAFLHILRTYPVISIHAPTRGATFRVVIKNPAVKISIHAPTRGATAIFAKKFSFLSAKIV